jgi:hypothetical protein
LRSNFSPLAGKHVGVVVPFEAPVRGHENKKNALNDDEDNFSREFLLSLAT